MTQPLTGIRVIDLTRVLSGPFCTMLLADMGADVVKIETGQGDTVRAQGDTSRGMSWYFAAFNRNKRSVVIDLRKPEGKDVLAKLISGADVLVENFRPGVLADMGFTQSRLDALNPRLIVGTINGYGSIGPYAERPAFDFIAQAMSGFMATTGEPGGAPMRAGPPITDLVAGLYCAFGIVNALRARDQTGRGQRVEAAMVNGMVSMLAYLASEYFSTGKAPDRTGNDHPIASPYGLFKTSNGDIAVAPATAEIMQKLFTVIGAPEVPANPEFQTAEQRRAKRAALNALVDARLQSNTQDYWIEKLNAAGIPAGKVFSIPELFDDPQIKAQDMVLDVEHPNQGTVRMTGFPVKLSDTPCVIRHPAPALGAHTSQVLAELGLDAAAIESLKAAKVVR